MSLLKASKVYRPFEYPWAYDYWKRQQQLHWLPEEVPLGEDCRNWTRDLDDHERNLLTQIFRFFTQADVEVQDCYMSKYGTVFKPTEIKMMLTAFSNMECFDDQSELLTSTGWKNVADVTEDDLIAQYDIESSAVSFVKPKKVVNYPYTGIMHHYKNKTTDIMVTPNHDLIARSYSTTKVSKIKSEERDLGRNYAYPATGNSAVTGKCVSALDRILIAIQADGCLRGLCPSAGEWRTVDFTFHKDRKAIRLLDLLEEAEIEYSVKISETSRRSRISFNLPQDIDISSIKDFGFIDLTKVSSEDATVLLEEILFWDGTLNRTSGQLAYYTTRTQAAGVVQALASLTGHMFATVGINRSKGNSVILPGGRFYQLTEDHLVVTFTEGRTEKTYPTREEVPYDGFVYCVSVDTENLVSRRNGKVAFTGNTVHIAAYSHLLDTIGMPESEYSAFLKYKEMKDKHDYLATFGVDTDEDIARTLAMFGGFTEGLQLFASFAMLMNFPRFNKMKGMGQIVTWSIRDETLHCEGIIRLFHEFCKERQCLTPAVKNDIMDMCQKTVRIEDAFIDLVFEMGPVHGMVPDDIKKYVRFIADWRLEQLGLPKIYMIDEHPIPWLIPMLNGVEHANFFETRATEYSKNASKGTWNEVWDAFDRRANGTILQVVK